MSEWTERGYSQIVQAQRTGKIKKVSCMQCEKCGAPAKHRHHEDYSRPLDVIYLCVKCHHDRHKEIGIGAVGRKKHYNFSRIPVGSFSLIDEKMSRLDYAVRAHSKRTGERFIKFRFDHRVVVFRLPDQSTYVPIPP